MVLSISKIFIIKGKSTPYEFDTKIPFYVRGPGVKPPSKENANSPTPPRKEITLNIDIAPTLLGFAGLSPPKSMDGLNMAGERIFFIFEFLRIKEQQLLQETSLNSRVFFNTVFTD